MSQGIRYGAGLTLAGLLLTVSVMQLQAAETVKTTTTTTTTTSTKTEGTQPVTTSPSPSPTPTTTTPTTTTPTTTTSTTTTPTTTTSTSCSTSGNTTTNLVPCTASYLSSAGSDAGAAIEIAPNGSVVMGGTLPGNNLNVTPVSLQINGSPAQGSGVVIRTNPTGTSILSVTRIGNVVDDLEVNRSNGNIAVATDYGIALLSPTANQVLWTKNLGSGGGAFASAGRRISVGSGGQVAALYNKRVYVFDAAGNPLGNFAPGGSYVEDVAVDSASGTVIVTGYSQRNTGGCSQLQVAFIRTFSYNGTAKWRGYDWTHAQAYAANSSCADTRGVRVAIGRDNLLYFAGETAGGNTIYRYSPQNLSLTAANVKTDAFNDPYNTASNHITYYTRLVPGTGQQVAGQFALARTSTGRGNTIRPRAITADELGNVYVSGVSTASFANRAAQTIANRTIGAYAGGDGFVLIASPDLRTRRLLTTWTGAAGTVSPGATITGVAVFQGTAAMISTSNGNMLTVSPRQGSSQGMSDGFYAVFPARK